MNAIPAATHVRPTSGATVSRLLHNPAVVVSVLVLITFVVVSTLASVIAPLDPNAVDLAATKAAPSPEHLLGGDSSGRDILSRLLYGGRATLVNASIAVAVGAASGAPIGVLAAYLGGWLDRVATWVSDLLQSIPGMIVLLIVAAGSGNDMRVVMASIGVLMAPGFFRMARSTTLSVRAEPYIDAAKVAGLSTARIVTSHVLRVVAAPLVIQIALVAGISMGIEAGLQYLGVGSAAIPSWGAMMNDGFQNYYSAPLMLLWPSAVLGIIIAALATLGAAVARAVDGRTLTRRAQRSAAAEDESTPTTGTLVHHRTRSALSIARLRVSYDSPGGATQVVHGVTLDVAPGEVVGIVGESGSGKSQTVLSVLGLLPRGGTARADGIWVGEEQVDQLPPAARRRFLGRTFGYIPQEPMSNLDPSFTIGWQLIEPLRHVHGLSRHEAKSRVRAQLIRVGIREPDRVMKLYPHEISGGMAQRVLIAGAVSGKPDVLIADEPTTALDVTVQAEVLDLLRELQHESQMALVLVTHNFGVVADLCDRVIVMQHGRIVETGPVRRVFQDPQHPYTAALISTAQSFDRSRAEDDQRLVQEEAHG